MKFKVGNKVVINPIFKKDIVKSWWDKWNGKKMTIEKIRTGISYTSVYVEENIGQWNMKHLMLYPDDFIKEEEFNI